MFTRGPKVYQSTLIITTLLDESSDERQSPLNLLRGRKQKNRHWRCGPGMIEWIHPGKFKTDHYILSIDSCFQGNTYSNSRDDHLLYSIHVPFQGVITSVLAHSLPRFPTLIVVDWKTRPWRPSLLFRCSAPEIFSTKTITCLGQRISIKTSFAISGLGGGVC